MTTNSPIDSDLRYVRRVLESPTPTEQDRKAAIAIVQALRDGLRDEPRIAYEARYPAGTPWLELDESTRLMWIEHTRKP